MVDISKVKSGDMVVFHSDKKQVEVEVIGVDPLMEEIYGLDLQGEDGVLNIIVNTKGVDILGESPLGDIYKVVKKAKKVQQVDYELAEFDKERGLASGN